MKVGLLLSGGPDSTALLYDLLQQGKEVVTFTFNAGEFEALAEKRCAENLSNKLGVKNVFVDFLPPLQSLYQTHSPMLMRYADRPFIVPFGSGIALSLAASAAIKEGADKLYYGVHADDRKYSDNTEEYFSLISKAITIEQGKPFEIVAPYLDMSKSEVLQRGVNLGMRIEDTWSCANSSKFECKKCDACIARLSAISSLKLTV